jgi:anti-sigma factor RsiW
MKSIRPITEDDLHAVIDQALGPDRQVEVQDYLDAHPDVAVRVAAYVRQREALRAALAPVVKEPIPPQLNLRHLVETRRTSGVAPWRSLAAAMLLFVIGGVGGWAIRGTASPPEAASGIAALAQEAAYTYDVYGADTAHPVEFKAADKIELVNWISSRIQRNIRVPDLSASGYRLMGGRLVATPHGPAGLLMYDNGQGLRLAMLVRPMTIDRETKMSEHSYGEVQGFAWANRGLGYSLVGAATPDLLHPFANEVRRQETETI